MLVTAFASAVEGVNAYTITLEVNASPGMPNFFLTGLADSGFRAGAEAWGLSSAGLGTRLSD